MSQKFGKQDRDEKTERKNFLTTDFTDGNNTECILLPQSLYRFEALAIPVAVAAAC